MIINKVKVPQISVIMKDRLLVWAVNHGPKTISKINMVFFEVVPVN